MAFDERTAPIEVYSAQARTAGSTSASIDRQSYGRAQTFTYILSVGTVSGTTPSMTVTIQDSDDGTTFANVTAVTGVNEVFTPTTAAAFKLATVKRVRRFQRVVVAMTGTTPSFTFSLVAVAGDPLEGNI